MKTRIFYFIFIFITLLSTSTKATDLTFEKFPYNDKLPSNSVIRIYNDKDGYMWFGTKDGLCRFDGYDIKVFRSSALNPRKLTNNEIQCISEDNQHRLWVGTMEGIVIIDENNYSISHFNNQYTNHDRINAIITDKKGYVWIGTSSYGILKINPINNKIEHFTSSANSKFQLPSNNVTNIYEDASGRIWLSFWKDGLCFINKSRSSLTKLPQIGSTNNPFRIMEDHLGLFWICTWGDGIYTMTVNNGIHISPLKVSQKSTAKVNNIVYSITQDNKYGHIWAVTFTGLITIDKQHDGTFLVSDGNKYFNKNINKLFHEIIIDRKGNLWLGSVGDGIYTLNFNKLAIKNYPLKQIRSLLNFPSSVTQITETTPGNIFISINRIGLFYFDINTGTTSRPNSPSLKNLNSISSMIYLKKKNELWLTNEGEDIIYTYKNDGNQLHLINYFSLENTKTAHENTINNMLEDKNGNIWIGSSNGLYIKPLNKHIQLVSAKINNIETLNEDNNNNIWIGTDKEGVFICNPELNGNKPQYKFTNVPLKIKDYQSLGVQSICCAPNKNVYIGTKEGCLFLYNEATKTAKDISGTYGITEEGIMNIIADNYGYLWISTIKRIIRYNTKNHASTYYSGSDGVLVNSFYKDACKKLDNGMILFGGNKGISGFNTKDQASNKMATTNHVAITDIQIQNKSIFDFQPDKFYDSIGHTVKLNYSESNFSIEFSALDYASANKIQYAYKLSGVDKGWNYVGNNRRYVNYSNLPPGSYTFMVRASDANGTWSNDTTKLNIKILPPLYRTWWAYLLYLIILTIVGILLFRNISNRIRLRNELKISKIEKEKSEELAQIKLRYFTNISHELLTPLTIILLQIEKLQNKLKTETAQFDLMKENVIRLKRLIQQILVFRKTESGNMKLKIQKNDIVSFINNICQSNFKPLIQEKSIEFKFDTEQENFMAYFDPDKLDKIVYNILSNAFKYTPKGGKIIVKLSFTTRVDENIIRLSVSDSGPGISEEDIPNIFKRFYISKGSDQSQSHGIGLALTSDLLQLHKGKIDVKSEVGMGSVFTIELPVSMNAYTPEELSDDSDETAHFPDINDIVTTDITNDEDESDNTKEYTILLVEDNKELLNLITEHFENKYNVLRAENGIKALEIVKDQEVDLIISDVMMPEMDGLSFCKIIKNDLATSHISVLMLTAKNTTEDRIDCYNAGADAYIAKPFELSILNARVKNLISKRKKKVDDFKSNHEININSMEYCSIDEIFLNQAVKAVEDKIAEDNFDFDQFAIDMATSKSTLHRKLKSLTGLSPGEFIRSIRLKHAVQMLNNNVGNISEIAFAVGFNDPKYFSRCFKIEFGVTPKEFMETNKTKKL